MFETLQRTPAAAAATQSTGYRGEERRAGGRDGTSWLVHMLDEIDYGMLLVSADAQVTYLNHAARLELDGEHPLQLKGRNLGVHSAQDVAPFYDALAAAQRGLRRLLSLGEGEHRICMSVVPLPAMGGERGQLTLLVLGKRRFCEHLSVQGYARSLSLTPAETRVLELLCGGVCPSAIATQVGVRVSTVRTQIGSIRAKTGSTSIRDLLSQVAVLPPLVGALRQGAAARCGPCG